MPQTNVIANQAHIVKAIRQLLQERKPPQKSPLTPTQRFIVGDLKGLILQRDSGGKAQDYSHWELRKLKGTRTVLLATAVGRIERYILIGPRGSLQPLDSKSQLSQMDLDEAIAADATADANA